MSEEEAEAMDLATEVENLTVTESTKLEPQHACTEKIVKMVPCGNCGKECSQYCANCQKEGYCSVLCQKTRRSKHKDDCFPAKEEIGDGFRARGKGPRSFWIATRDIKEGERVFTDYPLMDGPGEEDDGPGAHVCIGCHDVLVNFTVHIDHRKCSHCRWPICGPTCSGSQRHLNECRTLCWMRYNHFSFEDVASSAGVVSLYKTIRYIRLLNLIKSDPMKWERILNLHVPPDELNAVAALRPMKVDQFDSTVEFYKNACGLDEFTSDMLDRFVATENYHCQRSYKSRKNKVELVIYDKETRMDLSCMENCYVRAIHPSESKKKSPHGIVVIALKPIQKGQRLTMSCCRIPRWDGTKRRRQFLMSNSLNPGALGFICKCPRCVDPTELGTYVSAVKCTKCPKGYLLPLNPLDDNSKWNCDSHDCSSVIPGSVVDEIVDKIQKEADAIQTTPRTVLGSPADPFPISFPEFVEIEKFVKKYRKALHPHHYILLNAQELITGNYVRKLIKIMITDEGLQPVELQLLRYEINRLRTLAENFLDVAIKIFPPFSHRRVDGHFFTAMGNFFSALLAVTDGGEFDTVLNFLTSGISHKHSLQDMNRKTNGAFPSDGDYFDDEINRWKIILEKTFKFVIELCSSIPIYRGIPAKIVEFAQNLCSTEKAPSSEERASQN